LPCWGVWLVVAVVCAIAEIFTTGFFVIWFSAGALVALLLSVFNQGLILQIASFIGISSILILSTKRISSRWISKDREVKTNVYALEGKTGYVIQEIPEGEFGQVRIDGETWTARSESGAKIPCGAKVKVVKVEGVHLVVNSYE